MSYGQPRNQLEAEYKIKSNGLKQYLKNMRTIKFRIWNPEEKKMVESGATPMMLHSFFEYTARFNTQYEMPYQQFTGLLSKDGKEIYEGDILKQATYGDWNSEDDLKEFTVEMPDFLEDKGLYENEYGYSYKPENLNVIGNIHDTPELLIPPRLNPNKP